MILTLALYKAYLNISGTTYDEILEDMIDSCEAEIEAYLGYPLGSDDFVETLNGEGYNFLHLPHRNVTAVSKLEYYNGSEWIELVSGVDYDRLIINYGSFIYVDDVIFEKGYSNYRVSYTAGYTTVPADLQLAMKRLLKLRWDETPMGRNALGVSSVSDNGGINSSTSISKDDEGKVFKTLDKHKNINV